MLPGVSYKSPLHQMTQTTKKPRIDTPVAPAIVDELLRKFVDFRRAYEPDGLTPAEFDSFGPTVRTLRQFSDACHDLERFVRDIVLSNPDLALSPR